MLDGHPVFFSAHLWGNAHDLVSSLPTYHRVWENDVRLLRAASLTALDSASGSFYAATPTGSTQTIYLNVGSNPATNGKTYEYAKRPFGVNLGEFGTIRHITGMRNGGKDGSIRVVGRDGLIEYCIARDGKTHNLFIASGVVRNSQAIDGELETNPGNATLFVAYQNDPAGQIAVFENCVADALTYNDGTNGFYAHGTVAGWDKVIFRNCYAGNCGLGFSASAITLSVVGCLSQANKTGLSGEVTNLYVLESIFDNRTSGSNPVLSGVGSIAPNQTIVGCQFHFGKANNSMLRFVENNKTLVIKNNTFHGFTDVSPNFGIEILGTGCKATIERNVFLHAWLFGVSITSTLAAGSSIDYNVYYHVNRCDYNGVTGYTPDFAGWKTAVAAFGGEANSIFTPEGTPPYSNIPVFGDWFAFSVDSTHTTYIRGAGHELPYIETLKSTALDTELILANNTLVGNASGFPGTPVGLTPSQAKTLLAISWADIISKPTTFAPSAHIHALDDISGFGTDVRVALAISLGDPGSVVTRSGDIGTARGNSLAFFDNANSEYATLGIDDGDLAVTSPSYGYKTVAYRGTLDATDIVSGILPVAQGGTGVSTSTGTGSTVRSNSPSLTGSTLIDGILLKQGVAGSLYLRNSADSAYVNVKCLSVGSIGTNAGGSVEVNGVGGSFYFYPNSVSVTGKMDNPANGQYRFMNGAETSRTLLDFTTDATLRVRNGTNSADAEIFAGAITSSGTLSGKLLDVSNSAAMASPSMGSLLAPNASGDTYISVGRSLSSGNAALFGQGFDGLDKYAFMTIYGQTASALRVFNSGTVAMGAGADSGHQLQVNGSAKVSGVFQTTGAYTILSSLVVLAPGGPVWKNVSGTHAFRNSPDNADAAISCAGIAASGNITTSGGIFYGTGASFGQGGGYTYLQADASPNASLVLQNSNRVWIQNAGQIYLEASSSRLVVPPEFPIGWTSSSMNASGSTDTNLSRYTAGELQIGTTAANALGKMRMAGLTVAAPTNSNSILTINSTGTGIPQVAMDLGTTGQPWFIYVNSGNNFAIGKYGYTDAVQFNPTTRNATFSSVVSANGFNLSDNPTVSAGSGAASEIRFFNGSGTNWCGRISTVAQDLPSNFSIQWHPSGTLSSYDTVISRYAAGELTVGTTSANQLGKIRALEFLDATGNGGIASYASFQLGFFSGAPAGGAWNHPSGSTYQGLTQRGNNGLFWAPYGSNLAAGTVAYGIQPAASGGVALEINNGTAGTLRDLNLRTLTASGTGTHRFGLVNAGMTFVADVDNSSISLNNASVGSTTLINYYGLNMIRGAGSGIRFSTSVDAGTGQVGIFSPDTSTVEINNGTQGTLRDLKLRNINLTQPYGSNQQLTFREVSGARGVYASFFDGAGALRFGRTDHSNFLSVVPDPTAASFECAGDCKVILSNTAAGGVTITSANNGNSGPIDLGRRYSDSTTGVGAEVRCWPTAAQSTPAFSVVAPGGASRDFQVFRGGDMQTNGKITVAGRIDGPLNMIFRCAGTGGSNGLWSFEDINGSVRCSIGCVTGQFNSDSGIGGRSTSRQAIANDVALDLIRNDFIQSRNANFGSPESSIYSSSAALWCFGDGGLNSLGSIQFVNATASGVITSTFTSLSANPTTSDLSSGQSRLFKNTTSGVVSLWVNNAGVMRSVALT